MSILLELLLPAEDQVHFIRDFPVTNNVRNVQEAMSEIYKFTKPPNQFTIIHKGQILLPSIEISSLRYKYEPIISLIVTENDLRQKNENLGLPFMSNPMTNEGGAFVTIVNGQQPRNIIEERDNNNRNTNIEIAPGIHISMNNSNPNIRMQRPGLRDSIIHTARFLSIFSSVFILSTFFIEPFAIFYRICFTIKVLLFVFYIPIRIFKWFYFSNITIETIKNAFREFYRVFNPFWDGMAFRRHYIAS